MTIKEWSEALNIMYDADPDCGPEPLYPRHEEIEVFVDPADVPDEDIERLEELGFYPQPTGPTPHFNVFV